jgi:hypothetical protein
MTNIMMRSGLYAEMMQRRAEGNVEPVKIMVLDDWIAAGRTIGLALDSFKQDGRFQKDKDFTYTHATMTGPLDSSMGVEHVYGTPHRLGSVWDNKNSAFGVMYAVEDTEYEPDHPLAGLSTAQPIVQHSPYTLEQRKELERVFHDRYVTLAATPVTGP